MAVSRSGRPSRRRRRGSPGLAVLLGAFALLALSPTATVGQTGSVGCLPTDGTAAVPEAASPAR